MSIEFYLHQLITLDFLYYFFTKTLKLAISDKDLPHSFVFWRIKFTDRHRHIFILAPGTWWITTVEFYIMSADLRLQLSDLVLLLFYLNSKIIDFILDISDFLQILLLLVVELLLDVNYLFPDVLYHYLFFLPHI